jgi:hypothetical protein
VVGRGLELLVGVGIDRENRDTGNECLGGVLDKSCQAGIALLRQKPADEKIQKKYSNG